MSVAIKFGFAENITCKGGRKGIRFVQLERAVLRVQLEQSKESEAEKPEFPMIESLSKREIDVLKLMAMGLTNQVIATRLYLSRNTIKVHTRNIFGKLGVNNRTQAVARARTLGILS